MISDELKHIIDSHRDGHVRRNALTSFDVVGKQFIQDFGFDWSQSILSILNVIKPCACSLGTRKLSLTRDIEEGDYMMAVKCRNCGEQCPTKRVAEESINLEEIFQVYKEWGDYIEPKRKAIEEERSKKSAEFWSLYSGAGRTRRRGSLPRPVLRGSVRSGEVSRSSRSFSELMQESAERDSNEEGGSSGTRLHMGTSITDAIRATRSAWITLDD